MIKTSVLVFILALFCCSYFAQTQDIAVMPENEVSDSLMLSLEQKITSEYGINYNSTLAKVAETLNLDLTALKIQLGLEPNNDKLDKMRLRQLGVSVYSVLLAQETIKYGFNTSSTLQQISEQYSIPIKKLKAILHLENNNRSLNNRSLLSLNIPLDEIVRLRNEFNDSLITMGGSILLVGMIVVFTALLLTSLIIAQLRHLNLKDKPAGTDLKINSKGGVITKKGNISNDEIIAVITALHIYIRQLEERRKIALTFHRGNVNFWHASRLNDMPNRIFNGKHT